MSDLDVQSAGCICHDVTPPAGGLLGWVLRRLPLVVLRRSSLEWLAEEYRHEHVERVGHQTTAMHYAAALYAASTDETRAALLADPMACDAITYVVNHAEDHLAGMSSTYPTVMERALVLLRGTTAKLATTEDLHEPGW